MTNRTDFALDLKAARRQSGLTQADCAHLMGCNATKLTRLEHGETLPGLKDILFLGLIFGKTFESLFAYLLNEARGLLATRLETLPDAPKQWTGARNRQQTLNRIAANLAEHHHRKRGRA